MKISIITACYNAEKTVADAMASVGRQTFEKLEIEYIVVDGGSTDGTVEKIKSYELGMRNEGRRNFTFKWVSGKDRGLYDALNKGMRMATGDVIGILNADDVLAEDDVLAKIAAAFADPKIDGTYADIRFVREGGEKVEGVEKLRGLRTVRYCSGKRFRPWMFRFGTQTAHPSTFFRKECFVKWGEYSLDYGMYGDFELLCRFIWKNRARMKYLPFCTTVMRLGGASTNGWRTTLKINRSDLKALRANGCWSCLPLLYVRYLFKIWGFLCRRSARGIGVASAEVLLLAVSVLAGCSTVRTEPLGVERARSAETLSEFVRDSEPEGLSGIARCEGDRYFSVDDRGGLLHELEIVLDDVGEIQTCAVKRSVKLAGRKDLEGCAYDPLDGRVWVSDEHDTTICQFDPESGEETARVAIPEVYRKNVVKNRSFEGLAITPDGFRMYVVNEDTLTCDGPVADTEHGGIVRVQEFVRAGKGAKWMPTRQFRYRTEKVSGAKFSGLSVSGVAGLCAPGDGTLLLLEREMSQKNPLFPSFRARLYEIDLDTDALEPPKRLVWDEDTMFANYEGICLGPALKDGTKTLVLVSDGGGGAEENLLVLALSGGK